MVSSVAPGMPGRYPARAGGPWLCSTLVLSLFQAVVVPSGLTTRVQPRRVNHDLMVERAQEHAVLMGTWQATANAVQGCEPFVKRRGLPADARASSSLAGDAFCRTGRIWRVQLVPVIPGNARDVIPGVRSGLQRRPPIVRHAGLPARKPWFAAVWVVVA